MNVIHESGDDVLSLLKRVVRSLTGFLGLAENLHVPARIRFDHPKIDRVGENPRCQRTDVLKRMASKRLRQTRQERAAHVGAILLQRHRSEVCLEVLVPNLLVPVHGGSAEIFFRERKVRLLPELRDRDVFRITSAGKSIVDLDHEISAKLLHGFAGARVVLVIPHT